jgi:hypothetical protein
MKSEIVPNKGQRELDHDFVLTLSFCVNSYLYLIANGLVDNEEQKKCRCNCLLTLQIHRHFTISEIKTLIVR